MVSWVKDTIRGWLTLAHPRFLQLNMTKGGRITPTVSQLLGHLGTKFQRPPSAPIFGVQEFNGAIPNIGRCNRKSKMAAVKGKYLYIIF
jgi:hypothetical protein